MPVQVVAEAAEGRVASPPDLRGEAPAYKQLSDRGHIVTRFYGIDGM